MHLGGKGNDERTGGAEGFLFEGGKDQRRTYWVEKLMLAQCFGGGPSPAYSPKAKRKLKGFIVAPTKGF